MTRNMIRSAMCSAALMTVISLGSTASAGLTSPEELRKWLEQDKVALGEAEADLRHIDQKIAVVKKELDQARLVTKKSQVKQGASGQLELLRTLTELQRERQRVQARIGSLRKEINWLVAQLQSDSELEPNTKG